MNPTIPIIHIFWALSEDLRLNVGADARAIDGRPDDIGNLVPAGGHSWSSFLMFLSCVGEHKQYDQGLR